MRGYEGEGGRMAASQSLVNETEAVETAEEMKRQTDRKFLKYIYEIE